MAKHVNITKSKPPHKSMDFDFLRLKAIEFAQQLSGAVWTDYNEHDPGVTILEYLSFAITDLAYRTDFDVQDILYAQEESRGRLINNAFFTPAKILPARPITINDYRRLIIDRIVGVRNVWVEPVKENALNYNGLMRIFLQLSDGYGSARQRTRILDEVEQLIMENRNLCEDLDRISILESEKITVEADVMIKPDAFGEFVLARIHYELEEHLNPAIKYYTKQELVQEGYPLDDIYEGPIPILGFVKSEDLKPKPSSAYVSKLREIINGVEGVQLVNNITVRKEGKRIEGDEITPGENTYLTLSHDLTSNAGRDTYIKLFRVNVPVEINLTQASQYLNNLTARDRKAYQIEIDHSEPARISSMKRAAIKKYFSFQDLFPAVYGIGPFGLPVDSTRYRKSQARQLKAYLLIFEQLLANYLAQLTSIPKLFSIDKEADIQIDESDEEANARSYFSQFPIDIPDILPLFNAGNSEYN